MKRTLILFLILAAPSVLSCIAFQSVMGSQTWGTISQGHFKGSAMEPGLLIAAAPEIEYDPENIVEEGSKGRDGNKVTIIGCDGSAWETEGFTAGQTELAGTWVGHDKSRAGELSITFTYSGRFEIKEPNGVWYEGRYVCDARKDPKILNLYIKEAGNSALVGQTLLMIYKVDPTILTCASSEPGAKNRPGSFSSESNVKLIVVRKQ